MQWTQHHDPAGFSIEHPVGWTVQTIPGPILIVIARSADGQSVAVIQSLGYLRDRTATDIISKGLFETAMLFPSAHAESVAPGGGNTTVGNITYRAPNTALARGRLTVMAQDGAGTLCAYGAPETQFALLEADLARITKSLRFPAPVDQAKKVTPPQPPPPNAGAPLVYTRYTEPHALASSVEVPQSWRTRGGFAHPIPGDRRPWFETHSRDGIYILAGDPEFPQSLVHFPASFEGIEVPMAAGGMFLNLKPTAERLADHYLKKVAAHRFGAIQSPQRRPRPDIVQLMQAATQKLGIPIAKKFKYSAVETIFQLVQGNQMRAASLLTTAAFNGEYAMGMWAFWDGGVSLCIAPPALMGQADQVRTHMLSTYQNTPRMMEIYRQDEAMIAAGGAAAHQRQLQWFNGQQIAHNTQIAMGETIVQNYWHQQQANENMWRQWDQSQAVNDRLSQDRSDQMLDNQRLADDGMGNQYNAPAGHNYYWLDQQTGTVTPTDTDTPPDYSRNYTPLRKT